MCQCNHCEYCKSYQTKGNKFAKRTAYHCKHPDQKAIKQFFDEHKMIKMIGFIGFSKTDGGFPIKRTPKWCPINQQSKKVKAMKRIPHMCINCKYYKSHRCLFDNSYIWNLFCEEPTKCKSWKLSDDYKKGGKFYEEERRKS